MGGRINICSPRLSHPFPSTLFKQVAFPLFLTPFHNYLPINKWLSLFFNRMYFNGFLIFNLKLWFKQMNIIYYWIQIKNKSEKNIKKRRVLSKLKISNTKKIVLIKNWAICSEKQSYRKVRYASRMILSI